jgi:hypothetical protein
MERVITSLDDKIDYYLHKISVAPGLTLHPRDLYEVPVLDAETYLLDQVMLEKGLLKINKESRVISAKGLEIANFGGWLSYRKQLHREGLRKETPRPEAERKLALENEMLIKENESLRDELRRRNEKEATTMQIIQNLVLQNRNNTILLLLAGAAIGFLLANLKSLLHFF